MRDVVDAYCLVKSRPRLSRVKHHFGMTREQLALERGLPLANWVLPGGDSFDDGQQQFVRTILEGREVSVEAVGRVGQVVRVELAVARTGDLQCWRDLHRLLERYAAAMREALLSSGNYRVEGGGAMQDAPPSVLGYELLVRVTLPLLSDPTDLSRVDGADVEAEVA